MVSQLVMCTKGERTKPIQVRSYNDGEVHEHEDVLAMEEPLEIQVVTSSGEDRLVHNVAVTMRTPGNDFELALGFLFSEGVLPDPSWVDDVTHLKDDRGACNLVRVFLKEAVPFHAEQLSRHVFTNSSCGICGKVAIEGIRATGLGNPKAAAPLPYPVLPVLPQRMRRAQSLFDVTGGLHACALFDWMGNLIATREDVGRHNALDKLIGHLFAEGLLPASNTILLLSGRVSFELVQKAILAGIPAIAAIGAPSSLAVELASEFNLTLAGFLRNGRFNLYHESI